MSLSSGPSLGLLVNAAQGDSFYNEFCRLLRGLDALIQCSVLDVIAAPPAGPADGARYLVAASGATGAFVGQGNSIARYSAVVGGWEFFTPQSGWEVNVVSTGATLKFDGAWKTVLAKSTGWSALTGVASRASIDTGTATVQQLAQVVKALVDDLTTQGRLSA